MKVSTIKEQRSALAPSHARAAVRLQAKRVCRACALSRGCESPTGKEVGTVKRRQGRHREVGSERSLSHSHDPTIRNRIVRLEAVGEPTEYGETRDFQDWP